MSEGKCDMSFAFADIRSLLDIKRDPKVKMIDRGDADLVWEFLRAFGRRLISSNRDTASLHPPRRFERKEVKRNDEILDLVSRLIVGDGVVGACALRELKGNAEFLVATNQHEHKEDYFQYGIQADRTKLSAIYPHKHIALYEGVAYLAHFGEDHKQLKRIEQKVRFQMGSFQTSKQLKVEFPYSEHQVSFPGSEPTITVKWTVKTGDFPRVDGLLVFPPKKYKLGPLTTAVGPLLRRVQQLGGMLAMRVRLAREGKARFSGEKRLEYEELMRKRTPWAIFLSQSLTYELTKPYKASLKVKTFMKKNSLFSQMSSFYERLLDVYERCVPVEALSMRNWLKANYSAASPPDFVTANPEPFIEKCSFYLNTLERVMKCVTEDSEDENSLLANVLGKVNPLVDGGQVGARIARGREKLHAEMRLLQILLEPGDTSKLQYCGISFLCCALCTLAMSSCQIPVRGSHARLFDAWHCPTVILRCPERLKAFLGPECYKAYRALAGKKCWPPTAVLKQDMRGNKNKTHCLQSVVLDAINVWRSINREFAKQLGEDSVYPEITEGDMAPSPLH